MLANAQKITFKHNSICKTHLEKLCRDTLRSGHSMKICCFKSHKLKVIFGHLLFNVLHSRGELRCSWNLSAVSGVICKIKNGSKALDLDELRRKKRVVNCSLWLLMKTSYSHIIGLLLEILPLFLSLYHIPKNIVSKQPNYLSLEIRWKLTLPA